MHNIYFKVSSRHRIKIKINKQSTNEVVNIQAYTFIRGAWLKCDYESSHQILVNTYLYRSVNSFDIDFVMRFFAVLPHVIYLYSSIAILPCTKSRNKPSIQSKLYNLLETLATHCTYSIAYKTNK